jgi:hypothetical protein
VTSRSTWRRSLAWSLLAPILGLAFAYIVFAGGGSENPAVVGYATGAMPFAAIAGAVAGWIGGRARELALGGRAAVAGGAASALVGATITAQLLATLRFRAQGASGFLSLQALPYTGEVLMLVGVLPALLALGGAAGRWYATRGTGMALLASVGVGVLAMALVGPSLIGVATLSRLPLVSPPALAALVVLIVGLGRLRVAPSDGAGQS